MRTLALLPLCFLGTGLCAQQAARVVTTITKGAPAWKTWKNDTCALDHPGAWSMDNSGITGTAVTFLAPRDSAGIAHARMELRVRDLAGATLDGPLAAHKAGDDLHLAQASVLGEEDQDGRHLRELEGTQDGRAVRVRQSTWAHGGKAYTLSYIADEAQYEEMLFLAEAMFNSFRFLP